MSEESLRVINQNSTALLAIDVASQAEAQIPSAVFGLSKSITFDDIYFDSTCLKLVIDFPVDLMLLRDAARTLMYATFIIRKHGLKYRMPQNPHVFMSEMDTLHIKCPPNAVQQTAKDNARKCFTR
jgi:hypothetical protein